MRKIRLELDALRVETFDTGAGTLNRGTVHGRNPTFEIDCGPYPPPEDSINVCATAAATCNQFTCAHTCGCGGGGTQTYEGWTCTCPYTEPDTGDINVCP